MPVGVCGEMGGRTLEAMALIGIGVRRLSITPVAVGPIKAMIRSLDRGAAVAALDRLLDEAAARHARRACRLGGEEQGVRSPEQAASGTVLRPASVDNGLATAMIAVVGRARRTVETESTDGGTRIWRSVRAVSVGERLRTAREAKGLSLEDVASQTRIPIRHLQHIEREEWDALPAITYCVGFARSYANAVGLDGAELGARAARPARRRPRAARRPPNIMSRPIRPGCRRARSP